MLAHPLSAAAMSLVVDASDYTLGAALQQRMNETLQPLGFFMKSVTLVQRKYSAHDRELLAIYTAVKRFRCAVEGRNFVIFLKLVTESS